MHKACAGGKEGHLSAVTQLLAGGADVHALNKWRETPLLTAANHGQAAAVEALLVADADPCRCTDTGWSPLSIAAYKGHDDVVELLLEQGAPTEEADPTLSALLQAATKGLPNTVELLLRHGADHTVTTKKGDTALSILVEQNLIDAAVEMVTEYKASIPRCSRDRKKVQRARLLINLRIKQQKEEGDFDEDDSDQDDSDEGANLALHDSGGSPKNTPSNGAKKKKKKGKKGMNAEQKAKAAEEALLLELEQEDAKAQKEEAAATSKRNKKKKKKERERQQKLEQEKLRREKEEKEAQEREKEKRIKEEKERKLREAKVKEQKELEMKEAVERQKKAAARQKERELKEKKRREKELQEQERRDAENKKLQLEKEQQIAKLAAAATSAKEQQMAQKRFDEIPRAPGTGNRGWEDKSSLQSQPQTKTVKGTVEDPYGVVGFLGFESTINKTAANSTPGSMVTEVSNETVDQTSQPAQPVQAEPAPVALLREDKISELFRQATSMSHSPTSNPLLSVDSRVVKTVIYKWIVRASYESSIAFLDPLIPSWTDTDYLVSFLQRQLISESRKASNGIVTNIEMMKEAGSHLAELCISLARDVVEYRDKFSSAYPEISDMSLKMRARTIMLNDGSDAVEIEWDNRSIFISRDNYQMLSDRYAGSQTLLLNSIFVLTKRYETTKMILRGTDLDCRLSRFVLSTLAMELKVEMELWTDPISVCGKNKFCGIFPDTDVLFGGLRPFVEQNNALEMLLAKEGGSVAVLPTFDSTTASFFAKRMLNILETTEGKGVPLSFVVLLPTQAFRNLSTPPMVENLSLLDTRLLQSHRQFIRHYESLNPGQHNLVHGSINGELKACNTGSLLLILQNDSGRAQFPLNEQSITNISRSLSVSTPFMSSNDAIHAFGEGSVPSSRGNSIPSSPVALQHTLSGFESVGAVNNNGNGSRRGRFVELVQDGEDDFANAEAMVSGMLSSLDISMSMFQDTPSQDVDIEAISLMGIGNPDVVNPRVGRQSGRFG